MENLNDLDRITRTIRTVSSMYDSFRDLEILDHMNLNKIEKLIEKKRRNLALYLFTICIKYFSISILCTMILINPFVAFGYIEEAMMIGSGFIGFATAIFINEINKIKNYDKNKSFNACFYHDIDDLMNRTKWSIKDKFKFYALYGGSKKLSKHHIYWYFVNIDDHNLNSMKNIRSILENDINVKVNKELKEYFESYNTDEINYCKITILTKKYISKLTLKRIFEDNKFIMPNELKPSQTSPILCVAMFIYINYLINDDGIPYFNKASTREDVKKYLEKTGDVSLFANVMLIGESIKRYYSANRNF